MIIQNSPMIAAVVLLSIYCLRLLAQEAQAGREQVAQEAAAWRDHEAKRLGSLEDKVHQLMVIVVLQGDPGGADQVREFVKSGFRAPAAAGLAVQ